MPNRIRITFIEDDSLAPVRFDVLEPAADIVVRTATVLKDRVATLCPVDEALARAS